MRCVVDFCAAANLLLLAAAPMLSYLGSWVFLYYNHEESNLDVVVLENDDTPAMDPNTTPILLLDLWEHAYYLDVSETRHSTNKLLVVNLRSARSVLRVRRFLRPVARKHDNVRLSMACSGDPSAQVDTRADFDASTPVALRPVRSFLTTSASCNWLISSTVVV